MPSADDHGGQAGRGPVLKVAIVGAYPADPARPAGGPEAGLSAMLPFLAGFEDLDLHVVTIDASVKSPRVDSSGRASVHRLPRMARFELWNAIGPGRRQVCRYLEALRPDVVHARDTYGLMVQNLPIPRVLSIHGFIHADTALQARRLSWLRARLWKLVEVRGWARHPHVIAISPYVRERLDGLARGVIHDVDNPVQAEFFDVRRDDQGNRVLFAGKITRLKNPLVILQAAERLGEAGRRIDIRVAGRCVDAAYSRRMQQFAHEAHLASNTTFLGQLDREGLRRELAAASVFVLPSLQENAPVSIGEAMAAGVPVVASNRCGMPYMVRDGESGFLIDPHRPEDLAGRLQELLADAGLRQRMGRMGRQIAQDRFHPRRVAARTRAVYLRAAGDRRPDDPDEQPTG